MTHVIFVATARAVVLAALLSLLAACGNKGDLVRPPAEPAKAPTSTDTDKR